MNDLYLIDISNIIHRAFHVHQDLATSYGFPIGAVYGTFNMIYSLIKEHQPHNMLICYDPIYNTSFRKSIYPNYKSNRTPKTIIDAQELIIKRMLQYLGIASIEVIGYEADDCIASAVTHYKDLYNIIIVTGDKDLLQLIDTNVSVLDTMKRCFYGEEDVAKKFGVKPNQISDYLAIAGDKVDDIPGIPGIGKMGARKLLSQYGTLDNIYKNADNITGALGMKIRTNKDKAFISKQLAHLYDNIIEVFPDISFKPKHSLKLMELFEKLEFNNTLYKLQHLWKIYNH